MPLRVAKQMDRAEADGQAASHERAVQILGREIVGRQQAAHAEAAEHAANHDQIGRPQGLVEVGEQQCPAEGDQKQAGDSNVRHLFDEKRKTNPNECGRRDRARAPAQRRAARHTPLTRRAAKWLRARGYGLAA